MKHRSDADYIDRTIATVRNHRDAANCWPQWANIFADEIEDLRAERDDLADALRRIAEGAWTNPLYPVQDVARAALDRRTPKENT